MIHCALGALNANCLEVHIVQGTSSGTPTLEKRGQDAGWSYPFFHSDSSAPTGWVLDSKISCDLTDNHILLFLSHQMICQRTLER